MQESIGMAPFIQKAQHQLNFMICSLIPNVLRTDTTSFLPGLQPCSLVLVLPAYPMLLPEEADPSIGLRAAQHTAEQARE